MDATALTVGVAHLELFGREFAVDVKDLFFPGNGLGHLGAENGLSHVGRGKDHGILALNDEVVEVDFGIGLILAVFDPLVCRLDGHDADLLGGSLGLFNIARDGGDWVKRHLLLLIVRVCHITSSLVQCS